MAAAILATMRWAKRTLPLAGTVVLKDSSGSPQARSGGDRRSAVAAAHQCTDPDNWTVYNTTVVVQGGRCGRCLHIWVPVTLRALPLACPSMRKGFAGKELTNAGAHAII